MKKRSYIDSMHFTGRIWMVLALCVMISVPLFFCIGNNAWPTLFSVLAGLGPIAVIFYPTAVIEVIAFSPLLGVGGTYLSFVSGNISDLKLPCALAAMESADVRPGSEEGEVISTISIAASTIVTTTVVTVLVVVIVVLMRVFGMDDTSQVKSTISFLAPALDNALPALFGALGASYFRKHFRISVIPVAVILILLLFNGTLASGTLVPVGVVVGLLSAHIMYKKGWLKNA
ncbi:MAG: hypothetical protein LBS36_12500 [Oscillospiraceae bacterium]|jgi:hypothetical protein|nr:hypothetical protein [Oscillospiraceae bacterium]